MKRLLVVSMVLGLLAPFTASVLAQPPPGESVWVNGNDTTYKLLAPKAPVPANGASAGSDAFPRPW